MSWRTDHTHTHAHKVKGINSEGHGTCQKADTVFSAVKRLHWPHHWPLGVSAPSQREPPILRGSFFLVIYSHVEHLVSLGFIQYPIFFSNMDFPTHCRLDLRSCGHVAMWPCVQVGGNRFWDFGLPDLAASSGEAERQIGSGALAVTSTSFPDPLYQQP